MIGQMDRWWEERKESRQAGQNVGWVFFLLTLMDIFIMSKYILFIIRNVLMINYKK